MSLEWTDVSYRRDGTCWSTYIGQVSRLKFCLVVSSHYLPGMDQCEYQGYVQTISPIPFAVSNDLETCKQLLVQYIEKGLKSALSQLEVN